MMAQNWLLRLISIFVIGTFIFFELVFATTSGPNSPSAARDEDVIGSQPWQNPTNIFSSNNVWSNASQVSGCVADKFSHYLNATEFGFAIPTGSTINGITVTFESHGDKFSESTAFWVVSLLKEGVVTGSNLGGAGNFMPDFTDDTTTFGSSSNLWGTTWSAEEINENDFGMVLQAGLSGDGACVTALVDHVTITIDYTGPTSCLIPASGNWTINNGAVCTLNVSDVVQGNFSILNGSLEIQSNGNLTIQGGYVFIYPGNNLTILSGGNLTG